MSFDTYLFYAFSVVALVAAMAVVTVKNPVHAALSLVLTAMGVAGIFLLLASEFLALAQVLIYEIGRASCRERV